ncbi:MAG: efflux RND transporter permease subunit [Thermodesulfovibrionales bacterium]
MNPIKSSLRYPSVTLVLTAMLVALGIHALMKMPRTEDPTVTIRTGLVIAQYPGATSEQVEKQVTKTLEKHIFKFPEVRKELTYSTSRPGFVIINVELEDYVKNSDLFWAKLRNEMIETAQTELPTGVRGPLVNSDFGDTVAMLLAIHGERYGYRELRDYLDTIQDRFRTVRDVGKMMRYGDQTEQVWVTGSLARLAQYFVNPDRIIQALEQRNTIAATGTAETSRSKIPMKTAGPFTTEDQIANVLVDVSKTGEPVYIKDFAKVERRYEDPVFLVRYDGKPSVLLSVEMQKGKNVAELGDRLDELMTQLRSLLPPDIKVDLIADQPHMVRERIAHLGHEFMLAIGSVILVTLILLPFHVALIAAVAIPVTLCITVGIMNAVGIPLHQVSIASLIVVLGIVVDDAIVIADNYVELLDHKVPRADAAWRSATEVFAPVLTATVTIVCSFLPLLILTGTAGEFIVALPLTVAIALSVSFIVACMLTPFLCRSFIEKGLHDDEGRAKKKSFNLLDGLQNVYGKAIVFFMRRKGVAMAVGLGVICAGVFLFKMVPWQFFPSAERNQFVIDVWMRQGTRIEATDAAMVRIEKYLAGRPEVAHYASFVGQSAPRFYYNVNPQQPDGAYGQFIVNTRSVKETPVLVADLQVKLAAVVPEALVIVKELKQGSVEEAPIEIRISGDDIATLKQIGTEVENIVRAVPFSQYVYRDYFNDSYMVNVDLENELANRLGLTNGAVSQILSGGFDGKPVGTFWEGDRPVTILLRLDKPERSSFDDVRDAYMESQLTRARVPLRAIADVKPQWQTSRIVRRNGVRTLTLRSYVKEGFYASTLLDAVAPKIAALKLPPGYRIYYGGEQFNQDDNTPQLFGALGISLIAIFLVLLIQFRNVSEPLVVMSSIPLALFGAAVGLLVTRNPFGFMAFIGLISLCGIVVRNAIILVDYIKEKIAEGHSLEQAATEAGQRRLRPIFLTTMAAAVGVSPMILSRSALWSPLASVIAFGLIFSMFFTLLVIPVLFVVIKSRTMRPVAAVVVISACALFGLSGKASAEGVEHPLTLPEAVEMALKQNHLIKIGRAKVTETDEKIVSTRAQYFPLLSNNSQSVALSNSDLVKISAGSLGNVPGFGPFPSQTVSINQGSSTFFLSETTLSQPTTQLLKIHAANEIARADYGIADAELNKSENEIVLAVHQVYYGLLVAYRQRVTAKAMLIAAQENMKENEEGVRSGNLLDVATTAGKANLLQARQELLTAENQISDLTSELNDLLGLPSDSPLEVTEAGLTELTEPLKDQAYDQARARNGELLAALESVEKSRFAVSAARYEYIPDITLFASALYQDGASFLKSNVGMFGAKMTWDIFDWGKRKGEIGQRNAQLLQAEENLARIDNRLKVELDKGYRKLERTKTMVDVAREVLLLCKENERLSRDRLKAGTVTTAKYAETVAALKKAEMEELQASLEYRLAQDEIYKTIGLLAPSKK